MAQGNAKAVPPPNRPKFSATYQPVKPPIPIGQIPQARAIQALLLQDIANPETKPSVRALLARTWFLGAECLRVLRNIPSPGQLRPDLDPVNLARALKRHRSRGTVLELQSSMPTTEPEDRSLSEPTTEPTTTTTTSEPEKNG